MPDEAGQPQTVDEWQEAATLAAGLRLIYDARLYGFIEGGPEIDVDRVDSILDEAATVGIVPTQEERQQAAIELIKEFGDA